MATEQITTITVKETIWLSVHWKTQIGNCKLQYDFGKYSVWTVGNYGILTFNLCWILRYSIYMGIFFPL